MANIITKGLLAVPFVLNSQPAVDYDDAKTQSLDTMARSARQRYAEIFRDVEDLIIDESKAYISDSYAMLT